jgi:hypothetical protein
MSRRASAASGAPRSRMADERDHRLPQRPPTPRAPRRGVDHRARAAETRPGSGREGPSIAITSQSHAGSPTPEGAEVDEAAKATVAVRGRLPAADRRRGPTTGAPGPTSCSNASRPRALDRRPDGTPRRRACRAPSEAPSASYVARGAKRGRSCAAHGGGPAGRVDAPQGGGGRPRARARERDLTLLHAHGGRPGSAVRASGRSTTGYG